MKKTGTMLLMLIMLVSISSTSQNPIDKQHQELVRNQQNSEDSLQDSNDNGEDPIEDTLDENVDGYKTSYNDGEEEFPKCPPDDNNVVDMTLCGTITFGRDVV